MCLLLIRMKDLIVKSNKLVQALQTLSLSETRLLQLAIIDARETGNGLSTTEPLELNAKRYALAFSVTLDTAYLALNEAEESLFKRQFTITEDNGSLTKSRWIQDANYQKGEGRILVTLTRVVIEHVTKIDGFEQYFTSYHLKKTSNFKSVYAIRLYELLMQWKSTNRTPVFHVDKFRNQLGVGANEYPRMEAFKRRVLDVAVDQINEFSDIEIKYDQHKKGRNICGFSFSFKLKKKNTKIEGEKFDSPKRAAELIKNTWNTSENSLFKSLHSKCPNLTKDYIENLAKSEKKTIHDLLNFMFMENAKVDSFELGY